MPFDPMQNIFLQQANQMPPDQAQVAANGTPVSLMSNEQYNQMKQGKVPMAPAMPAQNTDLGDDEKAKSQMGIAKFLEAAAPKTAAPQAASAPQSEMDKYLAAAQQSRDEQSGRFDQMQKYIDSLRGQKKGGIDSIDWTPLAALADAMNGGKTNLAASARAMAPTSQEDKDKYVNGLQNQLFDKQNQLSKENLAALGQKLQMDKANAQFAETMRHNRATEDNGASRQGAMGGRVEVMRDNQNQQAAAMFDKDPLIMKAAAQRNQIGIDSHTLNNPNAIINGQVADEISAGIATALSGGKSASLGATEMQRIKSAETDWAKMRQYIENKPVSALSPENRQQLQSILARLDEGYGNVAAARAEQLRKGRNYSYNPDANKIMDNKVDEYKHAPSSIAQAPSGPKPGDIEDGHRYKGGDPSNAANWEALR